MSRLNGIPIVEFALEYAAAGWPVFPCDSHSEKPRSKRPLVTAERDADGNTIPQSGWPQKATTDADQIRAWWRRWPGALIGCSPGRMGGFVVDLDPKGESVENVEARLVEALGLPLPECARTITQSGGRHLWFRRPDGEGPFGNATPGLQNIDIRCDSGYVILPPSRLENGRSYSWEGEPFRADGAPDVPGRLLELIESRGDAGGDLRDALPRPQARPRGEETPSDVARRKYALAALDRIGRDASMAMPGRRGTEIFSAACQLGRFLAADVISEREALAVLIDAAETTGLAKEDGAARVRREIARGLSAGRADASDVIARLEEVGRDAAARAARYGPPPSRDTRDGPEAGREMPRDDGPPSPPPDAPLPDGPPLEAEAAHFPSNDTGNGRRFALYYGYRPPVIDRDGRVERPALGEALHVPRVGWHVWNGSAWAKDPDELAARTRAHKLSERMKLEAQHLRMPRADLEAVAREDEVCDLIERLEKISSDERTEDQDLELAAAKAERRLIGDAHKRLSSRKSRHLSFANTTGNISRIEAVLKVAAVGLAQRLEALDADPLVVNCISGTLRFRVDRSGEEPVAHVVHSEHARDDLLSKVVAAEFKRKGAAAAKFEKFLTRIQPDPQIRGFIQRWFGLSLTGLTNEQKLAFFYGNGANGKSVLVEVIARIIGDYGATAKIESLVGKNRRGGGDATPDLVPLIGARMVRASEPEEGERLQEGKIKELTGGEPILVRALHSDFVEVTPRFKLTISGNYKPEIRGGDEGIWRRLLLVPFNETIPKAERRPFSEVVDELLEERDGIFAWMVEGLLEYLEHGLQEPHAVLEATRAYREDSDPTGQFLSRACLVTGDPRDTMLSRELAEAMAFWQSEQGAGVWTPRTISLRLKDKAGTWRDPRTGQTFIDRKASVQRYDGIKLLDDFARRLNDAPRDRDGRPHAGGRGAGGPEVAF